MRPRGAAGGAGLLLVLLAACSPRGEAEDRAGTTRLHLEPLGAPSLAADAELAATVCGVLRARLEEGGFPGEVHLEGERVVVSVAGELAEEALTAVEVAVTSRGGFGLAIVASDPAQDAWEAPRRRPRPGADDPVRLLHPDDPAHAFGGDDLEDLEVIRDAYDRPALGFRLREGRREAFTELTRSHQGEGLAWLFDGAVVASPTILDPLPGRGILVGAFEPGEARGIAAAVLGGELPFALARVEPR